MESEVLAIFKEPHCPLLGFCGGGVGWSALLSKGLREGARIPER